VVPVVVPPFEVLEGIPPVAVSTAVKLTGWLQTDGFGAEPRVMEVATRTDCDRVPVLVV
jgi:hypothetical protein